MACNKNPERSIHQMSPPPPEEVFMFFALVVPCSHFHPGQRRPFHYPHLHGHLSCPRCVESWTVMPFTCNGSLAHSPIKHARPARPSLAALSLAPLHHCVLPHPKAQAMFVMAACPRFSLTPRMIDPPASNHPLYILCVPMTCSCAPLSCGPAPCIALLLRPCITLPLCPCTCLSLRPLVIVFP